MSTNNHSYHSAGSSPKNGSPGEYNALNGQGMPEKNQEYETDIKQQFYTIWHHKWWIGASILIFTILATLLAYTITPIYRSEGSILVSESQSNFGGLGGGSESSGLANILSSSYGLGAGSTLANELQILQSRHLSYLIADTLMEKRLMKNGRQFPILFREYPEDSMRTSQDTVAMRLRNNLYFSRVDQDAEVIQIAYESPSPLEVAFIVNSSIELYNKLSTGQNRNSANSAVNFLVKEQNKIEKDLHESEEKLRKFMNRSQLIQVDSQTQELIKQMAELEARRQEARAKLVAANSAIAQYQGQLNNIKPGLAEQYSEAIGPNITKLQYAKSELELQKQQLLVKNPALDNSSPQVADLNRQISNYKNRIEKLTQNLINKGDQYLGFLGAGESGIAQSFSQLNQKLIEAQVQQKQFKSQIDVIGAQLNKQQDFFDNLPNNIIQLARLKRNVKINEALFVSVSQQYAQTKLWEQTQFGLGKTIDRGYVPKKPVKPQKALYLIAGFMVGAILSIGYIFVRDAFNKRIDGVEKMRDKSEPLLSVIPQIDDYIKENYGKAEAVTVRGKEISTGMITILDNISPISESYRRLQNNIIYSNPDMSLKSIMITSSGKGEGKTTTISNLGVILAEAGHKVAIIDTDLRRPNLHNMFGLNQSPGIVEVLFDDFQLAEAIKETVVPGLSILTSGRQPPNPATITQSKAFLKMITRVEDSFDFVLIDTPPFGIITDASVLIRQTDGVAVVARFNETTEIQLSQTLEQLHRLNVSMLGTVLTAFDYTKSSDYHYGSNYYKQVYEDYNSYHTEKS